MAPAANFISAPVRAVPLELVVRARLRAGSRIMTRFAAIVAPRDWWFACRLPRRLHVCNAAIATLILVHLRVHITAARVAVCMHNGRRLHLCNAAVATLIFVHFRVDVTGTRVAVKHRRPLLTCTVSRGPFLCNPLTDRHLEACSTCLDARTSGMSFTFTFFCHPRGGAVNIHRMRREGTVYKTSRSFTSFIQTCHVHMFHSTT